MGQIDQSEFDARMQAFDEAQRLESSLHQPNLSVVRLLGKTRHGDVFPEGGAATVGPVNDRELWVNGCQRAAICASNSLINC